jgi:CubicO group peptidase (beta-lactamase class C family)
MTTTKETYMEAKHPLVASNLALLEVWLEAQRAYCGLPGVALGIVHDQALIYAKGIGYANLETQTPVTPQTIYRIASHSKLFTAIAIMQLRDQRKLNLDDPVKRYLPWFDIRNAYPQAAPITIRHLVTHTSGLPREAGSGYWTDFEFPTTHQVIERLFTQRTIYPAATRFKYSNLAPTLAGEIVATVSQQPFADYVQQHILDPLDMQNTSVVLPVDNNERLATGYGRRLPDGTRAPLPFVDAKGLGAATGLSSTIQDMAKFVAWQFRLRESNGAEVLKASTLQEMQRVHWLLPDWQSGQGLGFSIIHQAERDLIGHHGLYPGYATATYVSPQEKIGVIVLTNALDAQPYPGQPWSITDRTFEWIAPALTKAVNGEASPTKPDPKWTQFEGTYRSIWADTHVLVLDGKLSMIDPTLPNPKLMVLTLKPVSENTFKLEGVGLGPLGELVTFELGTDGGARSMEVGENRAIRVSY